MYHLGWTAKLFVAWLYILWPTHHILTFSHSQGSVSRDTAHNVSNLGILKQKHRKKVYQSTYRSYEAWENIIYRNPVTWEHFLQYPRVATARNKHYIRPTVLKSLQIYQEPVLNNSVCTETIGRNNEQAGASAMIINTDTFLKSWKDRKVRNLCEETAASKIHCYDSLPASTSTSATAGINPGVGSKSRFCIFENAMMDFSKVRKRRKAASPHSGGGGGSSSSGTAGRSWEQGFLSADCGDMAPEDIGYLPLYKPDIVGREDATCDYVFNETVLVYSHDNIRSYRTVVNDYLNVWSMLWLAGASHMSRDVTFLNIDNLFSPKRGKFFNDMPNQFFRNYNVSFRRVLRGADFAESKAKVCFKNLILQPRPLVPYLSQQQLGSVSTMTNSGGNGHSHGSGAVAVRAQARPAAAAAAAAAADNAVSDSTGEDRQGMREGYDACQSVNRRQQQYLATSALFQRWNLQIRQNYNLLELEERPRHVQILVLIRTRPTVTSTKTHGPVTSAAIARSIANTEEIQQALSAFLLQSNYRRDSDSNSDSNSGGGGARVVMLDVLAAPFEQQVRQVARSSLLVGIQGTGLSSMVHMAVGSSLCCGVLEIIPPSPNSAEGDGSSSSSSSSRYHEYGVAGGTNRRDSNSNSNRLLAQKLGHVYQKLDMSNSTKSSGGSAGINTKRVGGAFEGTYVSIPPLIATVSALLDDILNAGGSFFLPSVLDTPYL